MGWLGWLWAGLNMVCCCSSYIVDGNGKAVQLLDSASLPYYREQRLHIAHFFPYICSHFNLVHSGFYFFYKISFSFSRSKIKAVLWRKFTTLNICEKSFCISNCCTLAWKWIFFSKIQVDMETIYWKTTLCVYLMWPKQALQSRLWLTYVHRSVPCMATCML